MTAGGSSERNRSGKTGSAKTGPENTGPEMVPAREVRIRGIVQGVGFRPFVYRLAACLNIRGEVYNTSDGVLIHAEGTPDSLDAFFRRVVSEKPPPAHILHIESVAAVVAGYSGFSIAPSQSGTAFHASHIPAHILVSPDMATCDDCLHELLDPSDRRYRYPFINCTHCGPRYTIIDSVPYDRPGTTMRRFSMCAPCRAEYDDPSNRRFHAQPNACPVCGPRLFLHGAGGKRIDTIDPVRECARMLADGLIIAIRGLGGFHLAVDARNTRAVRRLREKKRRPEKPFALMAADVERVRECAAVPEAAQSLLNGPGRPIVLLEKKAPNALSPDIAPGSPRFGFMLAYTPLHHLLMDCGFPVLVMTSGNISGEPIASGNKEALSRLSGIADAFLLHDREIVSGTDDSIAIHAAGAARMVRRSRGWAPAPVFLGRAFPQVLGCGGDLKNTVCLTRGEYAFLSQHIGDMESPLAGTVFERTILHMEQLLGLRPEAAACDMHPDFVTTRYAQSLAGIPVVSVQHHHAHIVSCMAENGREEAVIGLAFDGSGYGPDGSVWGGEVLVADHASFDRAAHLACVSMPGGDAAVREPWRMALSYLHDAWPAARHGKGFGGGDLPLYDHIPEGAPAVIARMIAGGVQSPPTSSMGRLFDGVAALAGIRYRAGYEGQAAMELEAAAAEAAAGGLYTDDETYPYALPQVGRKEIPVAPIIRGVVEDVLAGRGQARIALRFHRTVIQLFADVCAAIRSERGLACVALSGGVFQNILLLEGLVEQLANIGFEVLTHRHVPATDGGLCLGQAVAAAAVVSGKTGAAGGNDSLRSPEKEGLRFGV